jgi:hypothetical protein
MDDARYLQGVIDDLLTILREMRDEHRRIADSLELLAVGGRDALGSIEEPPEARGETIAAIDFADVGSALDA